VSPDRRPAEVTPEPGSYDGHLKPFGSGINSTADMGSKYKFVPKEGPPPGLYDPNSSANKPRVQSAVIREDVSPFRRPLEISPDGGAYNDSKPFGAGLNSTASMGSKYKFQPKEGPPPGLYDPNQSAMKPRIQSAVIREDVSPERRPKEVTPDPGQYPDYRVFGSDIKPKIDMGNKYPWKPLTDGPGPGEYYDPKNPKIIGGYIEPEADRMYTLQDLEILQSQQKVSPIRSATMQRAMEAQSRSMNVSASATNMSPYKNNLNQSVSAVSGKTKASKRDTMSPEMMMYKNSLLERSV